ncbi:MAG: carboxylesterase family protein [Bacteroidales bacterium]|nr:carboxylesterase family protein [Bacteroidales bacterium]
MKKFILFAYGIFLMNCILTAQSYDAGTVKLKIQNGIIEGLQDSQTGLQYFLGIPFAKPPVGELRWKAPQPCDNWKGVRETKKFGPTPMQTEVFGDMKFRSDTMSEDCLYLNVWSPTKKDKKGLPVLVYFYGGGFVAGDGSEYRYDGASMAQKGIVVLTVNYRLNIFGFFAHPELSAEASYKASGNYGYLDQNAALKWVHDNIAAFGGDPQRVTIAGESAGSISVSAQMASPLSKGLFSAAIGESGAAIKPTLSPVPLKKGEQEGIDFVKQVGKSSIAELRALSAEELLDVYAKTNRFGFPSVIDGYFFVNSLPETFMAGQQAQVPMLVGWNSAEIPGFAFTQGPYSEEQYLKKVKEAYPDDYDLVLQLYPYSSPGEIELSATALASDRFISFSTWKWFDLQRKYSKQPVYRYLFCRIRPPLVDNSLASGLAGGTVKKDEKSQTPGPIGAPHASEIEYCMGNLYLVDDYGWTADDFKVSETMENYFANFIKTGNPNSKGLVVWPAVKPEDENPPVMNIDVVPKVINATDDDRYRFLDKNYARP